MTSRRLPRELIPMTRSVLTALAIAVAVPCAATGPGDAPRAVVQRMTTAALDVLRDNTATSQEKRHRLEQIVWAEVDMDTLSRLVLARNWTRFTPAQQAEFVKEFKEHLASTYGNKIKSYRNERVELTGDHTEERGDWTVNTKIIRGAGAGDIIVDYRLRSENGVWRIIDIVIEHVSLVANFRSQFQEIVSSGG